MMLLTIGENISKCFEVVRIYIPQLINGGFAAERAGPKGYSLVLVQRANERVLSGHKKNQRIDWGYR